MQGNLRNWRKTYNEVQALGKELYNYYPHVNKQGNYVTAKLFDDKEKEIIEKRIEKLCKNSDKNLDCLGLIGSAPLWKYNVDDTSTWASHNDFKYGHLVKR